MQIHGTIGFIWKCFWIGIWFIILIHNNLSNSYYLIDDLLHSKNILFRADVKGCNSPIYQNLYIYIYIHIYLHLFIYITINAVAAGVPWGHCTSEIFRTEIVKTITTSMFYDKILLLVSSFLIFFWKSKRSQWHGTHGDPYAFVCPFFFSSSDTFL